MAKEVSDFLKKTIKLTPEEIYNKNFSISYKGYDVKEVDHFLDKIISDYNVYLKTVKKITNEFAELENKNKDLETELKKLEDQVIAYQMNIQQSSKKIYNNLDLIKRINRLELIIDKLLKKINLSDDL